MITNGKQKKLIFVGVLMFVLMGLIPPWKYTISARAVESEKPAGYYLIVTPPDPENDHPAHGVEIDISRLTVQWLVIIAATGLGLFLTSQKSKPLAGRDQSKANKENVKATQEEINAAAKALFAEINQRNSDKKI